MTQLTSRLKFAIPLADRSDSADVPRDVRAMSTWVDLAVIYAGSGNLAARPVSTSGSPGIAGRVYRRTDLSPAQWQIDFGTGWENISNVVGPDSITAVELAPLAVTNAELADNAVALRNMTDASVGAAEIVDGSVGFGEIAAALKPSQGAGGGSESLRALGTSAGTAASGSHGAQHNPIGVDPTTTVFYRGGSIAAATSATDWDLLGSGCVVPAGAIGINKVLRATIWGTARNIASNWDARIAFGGQTVYSDVNPFGQIGLTSTNIIFKWVVEIMNLGAVDSQMLSNHFIGVDWSGVGDEPVTAPMTASFGDMDPAGNTQGLAGSLFNLSTAVSRAFAVIVRNDTLVSPNNITARASMVEIL